MDNQEENTQVPKPIAFIGTFLIWFFVWFFGGGLITWLPALSHGTDSDLLNCAVIAWASFPITISANSSLANKFTDKLVIANFVLWLFFTAWTWVSI